MLPGLLSLNYKFINISPLAGQQRLRGAAAGPACVPGITLLVLPLLMIISIASAASAPLGAPRIPARLWEEPQGRGVNEGGTKGLRSGRGAAPAALGGNALAFLYGLIFSEEDFTARVKNFEKQR